MEGRVRRFRGLVEVHTEHSHPIIGTPCEVPLPNMMTLIMRTWYRCAATSVKSPVFQPSIISGITLEPLAEQTITVKYLRSYSQP